MDFDKRRHDLAVKRFRVVAILLVGLMAIALVPMVFTGRRAVYMIIWLDTFATLLSVLWLAHARLRGKISRAKSRVLTAIVSIVAYGLTVTLILILRR